MPGCVMPVRYRKSALCRNGKGMMPALYFRDADGTMATELSGISAASRALLAAISAKVIPGAASPASSACTLTTRKGDVRALETLVHAGHD